MVSQLFSELQPRTRTSPPAIAAGALPITPNCEDCRMINSTVLKTFHNFIAQKFVINLSRRASRSVYYLLLHFHIVDTGIEPMKRR